MIRFKQSKFLMMALIYGLLLVSCSEESLVEPNNDNLSLRRDGTRDSRELFTISYEMDYAVITKFDCNPTKFDFAAGAPTTDKQKIEMTLFGDGSVKLTTEDLPSRNELLISHESLPNDLPVVKRTVLDNNQMSLYDETGSLIRTIPNQSIQLPFVAEEMMETLMYLDSTSTDISSILACLRANVNLDSLSSIISNPPKDVIVTKVTDDIYTIRTAVPVEMAIPKATSVVNIVNITDKLLLGSRLYDENGKTQQCLMFQYDDCIITGFKQEVHEELPDCDKAILQTIAEISNLDIIYPQLN